MVPSLLNSKITWRGGGPSNNKTLWWGRWAKFASVIGENSSLVPSDNFLSRNDLHDFMCSDLSQQYIFTQCPNSPQHIWYVDITLELLAECWPCLHQKWDLKSVTWGRPTPSIVPIVISGWCVQGCLDWTGETCFPSYSSSRQLSVLLGRNSFIHIAGTTLFAP